jgi:hypothetical protein
MRFDPNLASAAVYAVIACLYLRRRHGPACRVLLALAALMLAFCAAAKSDNVHRWRSHQPPHAISAERLTS